jgi:TATA-box binding protein (TBP) (component of TFIID and TFIIIB)
MTSNIDSDWESFIDPNFNVEVRQTLQHDKERSTTKVIPECTDLYVSTQTKIIYLESDQKENLLLDLNSLFWKIKVDDYKIPKEGVLKKQIKLTSTTKEELDLINKHIQNETRYNSNIILSNCRTNDQIKHTQKINIGISKKDIISCRVKEKGAFYNCFVLVFRIKTNGIFKEIHVKIFNTGKLEIPGIKYDYELHTTLSLLVNILSEVSPFTVSYKDTNISTVLINSNFNCGYYINRDEMYNLLRNKYNIIAVYDPCSYPGIQCKFYYNSSKLQQNGKCECAVRCCKNKHLNYNCQEISFMIFRTGSVLIVGRTTLSIIQSVYQYLKDIFANNYDILYVEYKGVIKQKHKNRTIKKEILFSSV